MRISSLFDSYKYHFIGAFFLLMLGTLAIKYYQVNSLRADLAESKAQVVILSVSIEKQNKAVKELAEDSARRVVKGSLALQKAKAIGQARLTKINALQKLTGTPLTCETAVTTAQGLL